MHTCGHGKPIDEFCESCEAMGEIVLGLRETIKKLEEENAKLRVAFRRLDEQKSATQSRLNRMYEDSYNDVTHERDER